MSFSERHAMPVIPWPSLLNKEKKKHNRDVSLSFLNVISTHSVTPSRLPNELEQITPQNWRKQNNNNKYKNHHQLQWS
jgi:hypothetical protein